MPTVSPPGSIDPTGGVDVSADLTAWFATVPAAGDTIEFDPAATYRVDHTVLVTDLDGFILDGQGALLFRDDGPLGTRSGPQLSILGGDGWEIRDLVIRGANTNAGVNGDYVQAKEAHHCLWMSGCENFWVHGCEFSQPFGDCSYFDARKVGPAGVESSYFWCHDGVYEANKVHHSGRQLITLQGVRDTVIQNCDIWQARRSTFELEPLAEAFNSADNIDILANRIGAGRFAVITNTGTGPCENITFEDNLLARSPLIVGVDGDGGRRSGWRIVNNRFITAGDDSPEVPVLATCAHHGSPSGAVMRFTRYDNLVITGNEANVDAGRTPSMVLVQLVDCLNYTVADNDVTEVVGGDGALQCQVVGPGEQLRDYPVAAPPNPPQPGEVSDAWSYTLGQAFIAAALSCGAECGRTWVSDGSHPEQPPPGCECQLVAVVSEGWEPPGGRECGVIRAFEVRLILDLCTVPPPGPDGIPDPTAINAKAMENAAIRWLMMRGLREGWLTGAFTAHGDELGPAAAYFGERVIPGPWRLTRSIGGMGRWESVWRVLDPI